MNIWKSYVDVNLVGAGLKQAAIAGQDGQIWAASAGFDLMPDEVLGLMSTFSAPTEALYYGFRIEGAKYFTLMADRWILHGRKGSQGCVCVKTSEEILIGIYDEDFPCNKALRILDRFAAYLVVLNF
ncbi:profilin [Pseudomonas sp. LS1212]|uniref:profilin n=1 Tax=Pseudomonas sp. LS1212 TaxID=2972478 RepID=UPI00215C9003|nr:profilin [Pseudomonas sp. LS1212]UVJ45500.1 profilin [Pseudomonas sp. LS1212]